VRPGRFVVLLRRFNEAAVRRRRRERDGHDDSQRSRRPKTTERCRWTNATDLCLVASTKPPSEDDGEGCAAAGVMLVADERKKQVLPR